MPYLDHFGLIAPFYDRVIRMQSREKLIALAGLSNGSRLLDAGGGTGRISQGLRELAASIVVVDESMGMLQQAMNKGGLETVCALTEHLPFDNQSFDCVLMIDALHHVFNQQHTISELWRVLKVGGRIVVEEPDIQKTSVKLIALFEKLALMRSHFLTSREIVALFKKYPSARIHTEKEGFNVWVLVEKQSPLLDRE